MKYLLLLFLCFSLNISGQVFRSNPYPYRYNPSTTSSFLKKRIPTYIGIFAAGTVDGFSENLKWKYYKFENTFPNAKREFWDPRESWRNKWKNGDPSQGERFLGSSTIFVGATDGYHMLNTTSRFLLKASYVINLRQIKNHDWKALLIDFGISTVMFGLGYNFTDRIILRN